MKIQFLGAAQTVTGSCYMIEANNVRFGIDCGMHQGNTAIEARNKDTDIYRAGDIDFFLVTHAHIDHSGLLPRMAADGFKGEVYCTEPTVDLLTIMLADSAHIQSMEADWRSRKQKRGGGQAVEPLYTQDDVDKIVKMLSPVTYDTRFEPAAGIQVTYKNAGHILGAAFLEIIITEGNDVTRLVFSGDLGRPGALIVDDPDVPDISAEYLFLESTYGDRDHKDEDSSRLELAEAIRYSFSRGEKVIIPAFAVERTQEILYSLYLMRKEGTLKPGTPIFVDSPLAIKATEIFRRYPQYYDDALRAILESGDDPFNLPEVRYTLSTQESQAINSYEGPAIIIAASGMCNAGRIKHHLRHNLWRPGASIVFVGYQSVGTPGRKIVDGAKSIRLLGEDMAVAAKIFTIGGFSAHAGQSQILHWVEQFTHRDMRVVLVHGEDKSQNALAALLKERFQLESIIPAYLEEMTLIPGKPVLVQKDVAKKAVPLVNWEILVQDTEAKVALLRASLDKLPRHEWSTQTELRDKLLDINAQILRLVSQV